jgi:hypothetical protein
LTLLATRVGADRVQILLEPLGVFAANGVQFGNDRVS